jgi:hypothetical protein
MNYPVLAYSGNLMYGPILAFLAGNFYAFIVLAAIIAGISCVVKSRAIHIACSVVTVALLGGAASSYSLQGQDHERDDLVYTATRGFQPSLKPKLQPENCDEQRIQDAGTFVDTVLVWKDLEIRDAVVRTEFSDLLAKKVIFFVALTECDSTPFGLERQAWGFARQITDLAVRDASLDSYVRARQSYIKSYKRSYWSNSAPLDLSAMLKTWPTKQALESASGRTPGGS